MPCVRAGLLSRCLETPAWIRAQGSHHALPRSGGEPASTALRGGRPSLGVAVSRKSFTHIRGTHPELQKLRAALCLLRRSAEREGCLQAEVGPLDSGCHRLAYQSQGEPCPMGVRAHSTRSVASSYALAHGASLADICRAAGWATPNTFARFYNLRVEPVSSRVLGNRKIAGRTGRCHACCAIPPHPGIRASVFSSSSVPRTANPGGVPPAPPAVRLGGAV